MLQILFLLITFGSGRRFHFLMYVLNSQACWVRPAWSLRLQFTY